MERGIKIGVLIVLFLFVLIPLISAGVFDWVKKAFTGKATDTSVILNLTVAGSNSPLVTWVGNDTGDITGLSEGPNEGPSITGIVLNFTVYDGDGFGNIDDSTARVNVTLNGENNRYNFSCVNLGDFSTYYTNYTCAVTMFWWDGPGTWTVNASISDNEGNPGSNASTTLQVGTTNGFTSSPSSLTWASITAGGTNLESNNDPVLINNTGNQHQDLEINATNLRGESNGDLALWAGNFTVSYTEGCEGVAMVSSTFTNITTANLTRGNFSLDDKSTGQEELHVCLEVAGSELTAQSYSTANEGTWTLKIT